MLNAKAVAMRAVARLSPARRPRPERAASLRPRSVAAARHLGARLAALAASVHLAPPPSVRRTARLDLRRLIVTRLSSERTVPVVAAVLILVASVVSFQPAAAQPTGTTAGAGSSARLAIGGGVQLSFDEQVGALTDGSAAADSSWVDDGTLYKPVAVDTTVADGRSLLRTYTVRSGDTLTGIANRFGVKMMTIWWANHLTSKDVLSPGQKLVIPPVNGLVVTVKDGDTLDSLAAANHIDAQQILDTNGLTDSNLVIGQVLTLPGATGAPIPTPKPVARSSGGTSSSLAHYGGGAFAWPVVGGGNYISQFFHYGHYALDIAASYGTKVVAAADGKVIFAGWKSNGGGWQVWISHGSNLYTTYNHMSALTVSTGQSVGRGQQVGRIGQSGWATGPHLHFEVWVGMIWGGGIQVNPLKYY